MGPFIASSTAFEIQFNVSFFSLNYLRFILGTSGYTIKIYYLTFMRSVITI